MTLLEECIEALQDDIKILDASSNSNVFKKFENSVPITSYGRIDWDNLNNFKKINSDTEILNHVASNDKCFIVWNEQSLPVIETTVESFLKNIDDVLAVSSDTWLFLEEKQVIIEFYHNRLITLLYLSE